MERFEEDALPKPLKQRCSWRWLRRSALASCYWKQGKNHFNKVTGWGKLNIFVHSPSFCCAHHHLSPLTNLLHEITPHAHLLCNAFIILFYVLFHLPVYQSTSATPSRPLCKFMILPPSSPYQVYCMQWSYIVLSCCPLQKWSQTSKVS